MRRLVRPFAAVALLLSSVPGTSVAAGPDDLQACRAEDQVVVRKDRWIEIKAPKVIAGKEGPRTIVDFATPTHAIGRVYTTNGTVVKASADSGCTWETIFDGNGRLDSRGAVQQDVFTHLAAPSPSSLWVASYDHAQGATRPHVYMAGGLTDNKKLAAASFQEVTLGMPQVGKPVALVAAPSPSNVVYVVIEGEPDPRRDPVKPWRRLFASVIPNNPPEAGAVTGLTWREVPLPAGLGPIDGVAPGKMGHAAYVWSGDRYAFAPDTTTDPVAWQEAAAPGRIVTVDVNSANVATLVHETAQGAQAVALNLEGAPRAALPVSRPTAFGHGGNRDVYVTAGPDGTFGHDRFLRQWIDITPRGVKPFSKLQMPQTNVSRAVLAHSGDSLFRWDLYEMERFVPPPKTKTGRLWALDHDYKGVGAPELTPTKQVVTLKPEELAAVPVKFRVNPSTTKLNVFFMVDDTASMDNAITGLKASTKEIALGLKQRFRDDACFGVGSFRDFLVQDSDQVYLARQKVVCEDDLTLPLVTKALDKLTAENGGDIPEAQTVALTQAVTGAGSLNPPVLPDQDAGFEAGAFKVIVLISDSDFKQDEPNGFPTIDSTIETLNTEEIKVVSVLVQGGPHMEEGRAHMEQLARGTGTLAPPGGVDCDGDGKFTGYDLAPDKPLVCDLSGSTPNIGPAILALVLAVADPGTMAVTVEDEHDIVQEPIRGLTRRVVNLKQPPSLDFTLPVKCAKAQDGLDLPVGLIPTVRGVPVGLYGEVVVQCRAAPVVPPKVNLPRPPLPQQEVVVEPRPSKPLVAIAIPQPPPAPAQPVSNMNLNAGMSQEEQQQYQLAAVTQGAQENEQPEELVELAMSDYRERDASAGASAMLAGATLMTAGAAVAYRRRLQRSHRTQAVRTR